MLKVFQSVLERYPLVEPEAWVMERVSPVRTIGAETARFV